MAATTMARTDSGAKSRSSSKASGGGVKLIPNKDLIKICRGLSSMLKADISTSEALEFYCQGLEDLDLKDTLLGIKRNLDAGIPVFSAFSKSGRFPSMFVVTVQAGENAGQLGQAFTAIGKRIKTEMMFASKLRGALMVPFCVILFQIGLFIWSQCNVVSKVEETLKGVGAKPDPLSAVIFSMSHVVQAIWPLMVGSIVAFIMAMMRSAKARAYVIEGMMKKWGLLRKLVMGLRQYAYLGTLNMMYANGINLAEASLLASKAVEGTPLFEQLVEASKRYKSSGLPYGEALKKYTKLDTQIPHMVGIGERSASLPLQLDLLSNMYEEDTAAYMSDFTAVISAITLAFAMAILAVIFAGSMLPIFLLGPRMMNAA